MKKFLIATSTLACLMAAPLAAQAAPASSQSSMSQPSASETPTVHKHSTVRRHVAQSHATHHRMATNQAKKNVNCPPGSQNAACHPSTTGSTR